MARHVTPRTPTAAQRQSELLSQQWRDLRNKLDSLLRANNIMTSNEARQACAALDGMTITERRAHIEKFWGPLYVDKAAPVLHQLELLETMISEAKT